MSNYFAVEPPVPSFDELFPQTPSGSIAYSSASFFTPNTLRYVHHQLVDESLTFGVRGVAFHYRDGIRFTPSAWRTPHRETVESPVRDTSPCDAHQALTTDTGASSFSLLGTPAHRVDLDTLGRSQTPHWMPGASQIASGNIGVTPARIMGAPPHMLL